MHSVFFSILLCRLPIYLRQDVTKRGQINVPWVRLLQSSCPGSKVLPKKLFVRDIFGLENENETKFGTQTDGIILNIF